MRLALISDVHGNAPALEAVLQKIDALGVDRILCMGDLVGYGPEPDICVDMIRERGIPCVLGNHDAAVCGRLEASFFLEPNRSLLQWTAEHLSDENRAWLDDLKLTLTQADIPGMDEGRGPWVMCHASPVQPDKWEWLDSAITCREVLEKTDYQFIFAGHTHVPALVANEMGVFGLEPGFRYLINPGAVGQSRDRDTRASFGILDTDEFSYTPYRVDYPLNRTLGAYHQIGIDHAVARRLLNLKR